MLGLAYQSNRGHLGVEYYGRTVTVKILPVGVDMAQLRSVVAAPEALATLRDLSLAFKDHVVLLGVDDVDLFKGIGLKFLAMERLLEKRPELRGRAVLVQIVNPARSHGRDVEEVADEAVPSSAASTPASAATTTTPSSSSTTPCRPSRRPPTTPPPSVSSSAPSATASTASPTSTPSTASSSLRPGVRRNRPLPRRHPLPPTAEHGGRHFPPRRHPLPAATERGGRRLLPHHAPLLLHPLRSPGV
uniref:Uncharacterized protein n=1 Tax=Ananas comosus var. bracteatus TaxID=296719 RepID=A0A6V7P912_ANACO|nr:unnamed protein product [Ananas comosus var. bracteatus]